MVMQICNPRSPHCSLPAAELQGQHVGGLPTGRVVHARVMLLSALPCKTPIPSHFSILAEHAYHLQGHGMPSAHLADDSACVMQLHGATACSFADRQALCTLSGETAYMQLHRCTYMCLKEQQCNVRVATNGCKVLHVHDMMMALLATGSTDDHIMRLASSLLVMNRTVNEMHDCHQQQHHQYVSSHLVHAGNSASSCDFSSRCVA